MYCLEVINKMNEKTEYFGEVKWSNEDLKTALEENGIAGTNENISKLYNAVNNHFLLII